jgi:hypothetical protein
MKLQQKIFGIGLLTAVSVPHLYEKGYTPFIHYDGSDTSQAFATHRLSLDSYRGRLLVVLPFNPDKSLLVATH